MQIWISLWGSNGDQSHRTHSLTLSFFLLPPLAYPTKLAALSVQAWTALNSPCWSVCCVSPLSLPFRTAQRMPQLSRMGVFFNSQDIDTVFFTDSLSYQPWRGLPPVLFSLPSTVLLYLPPFVVLLVFIFTPPIQMMSGTMTVRTKATGFPRFM